MDSRFENEFEQEEGRLRGRSRRRGAAVAAADSAGAAAEGFRRVHRMSSGTYFPKPVKAVAIPKKNGGTR